MGKYKDLWHFQCEYLLNKKNNYVLYIVHTYILYCDHSLLNNFKFSKSITRLNILATRKNLPPPHCNFLKFFLFFGGHKGAYTKLGNKIRIVSLFFTPFPFLLSFSLFFFSPSFLVFLSPHYFLKNSSLLFRGWGGGTA